MRRLLILAFLTIGCLVAAAAIGNHRAQAYSSCTVKLTIDKTNGTYAYTLCNGNVHIWAQSCSQMLMPGGWVTTPGPYACLTAATNNGYIEQQGGGLSLGTIACGRWYRGSLLENIAYQGNQQSYTAGKQFC